MILVTEANGQTGRAVVDELVAAGERVRAFDLAPEIKDLERPGQVEGFVGDLADSADVRRAMDGVRTVVYIGPTLDPREAHMGHTAVSEARGAGVAHFMLFSVVHPQLERIQNHVAKLEVERHLLMSRLPFRVLQPTYYMQHVDVAVAARRGVLVQPFAVEAKVAHVDLRNVATIAGQVVAAPASHAFATYELCGGDLRSGVELAEVIALESGRPVRAERWEMGVGSEAGPGATEVEDYRADAVIRLLDHYERYGLRGNANVLTWLLGRRPTSFPEYVRRCLARSTATHAP
jgi:uncharacterized protein YbjT (DUF2867 family)